MNIEDNNRLETNISEEKQKKLKYVKIYDALYLKIIHGEFQPGSQLPSEPELARMMGVSRMTLRQALSLLKEDGLINNIRGKGTFIMDEKNTVSFEHPFTGHPVYNWCSITPDKTELEFRIEPPSESIARTLQQKTPVVVIADRWYKNEDRVFAYSLSFLPVETITKYDIDLKDNISFLNFIQKAVYEKSDNTRINIRFSGAGNFTAQKYTLSEKGHFLMIQETLSDDRKIPFIVTKHYIPVDTTNINFTLNKLSFSH
ncbi:GntR family transcriptional regulator [Anaerocolumna xylanovorans]|uniref:DNA-binding transcriptional regulator, GntR family n=1 Tax=Anaerocolumna xylanovorans DSM 12503 TaxID=1121345 RepID=A0A1M7XZ26_9FIRM|nr:GntR family transcriptional regulator [Anaerocolumna xylanovorans]SHO44238.1 DNA-binding transcriptional regulator, GntR family [Anaerocolumna xylanovorans DSM 12503]